MINISLIIVSDVTPSNLTHHESPDGYFSVYFDKITNTKHTNVLKYTILPSFKIWSTNEKWNFDQNTMSFSLQQKKEQYMKIQHAIDISYIEMLHGNNFNYEGVCFVDNICLSDDDEPKIYYI